jgi:hypothetical protein
VRTRRRRRKWRRSNTRNAAEIDSWKMKPEEKEMKKKDKKSWTPFWSIGSRRKNKRPRVSNCKGRSKASSISKDSKKKTKSTSILPWSDKTRKNKGILILIFVNF